MASLETLTILVLALIIYLVLRHNTRTMMRTSPVAIQRLLNPPRRNTHQLLCARAQSNARLIRTFALTNTFVSASPTVHTEFVRHATSLLKAASRLGWYDFQQVVTASVDAALLVSDPDIAFDTFIQDATMRVILIGLFRVDANADELDTHDVRTAAHLINLMWSLSKKNTSIPADLLHRLNTHLKRLLTDTETYPNPLDFVIPAWETLWRVVATSVAHASIDIEVSIAFAELRSNPTITQFRHHTDSAPSAEWCIAETMRLHPPSKRITRSFSFTPFPAFPTGPSILETIGRNIGQSLEILLSWRECADIGTVLRSREIWGRDADKFDPLRFKPERVTVEQERIKPLPFGHGPHSCVAAHWAPMAAAMIAAEVLERLRSDFQLIRGPVVGGRNGWEGWMVKRK